MGEEKKKGKARSHLRVFGVRDCAEAEEAMPTHSTTRSLEKEVVFKVLEPPQHVLRSLAECFSKTSFSLLSFFLFTFLPIFFVSLFHSHLCILFSVCPKASPLPVNITSTAYPLFFLRFKSVFFYLYFIFQHRFPLPITSSFHTPFFVHSLLFFFSLSLPLS